MSYQYFGNYCEKVKLLIYKDNLNDIILIITIILDFSLSLFSSSFK